MTLRAIKGGCLVKPDEATEIGGILVPELVQRIGRDSGILIQADTTEPEILACIGKRVLLRTAMKFTYQNEEFLLTKIGQLMAVMETTTTVKILDPIERCQWCKSDGEGNMMLDHNGYCIRCGKNKYGEHRDHRSMKVSDDEKERFGKTADEYRHQHDPKGKIVSYAGQGKRSAATVPSHESSHVVPRPATQGHTQVLHDPDAGRIVSAAALRKRSRY